MAKKTIILKEILKIEDDSRKRTIAMATFLSGK